MSSDRHARRMMGFTLIEMAIAIAVIALLLGSILVPLQTHVESRKYDETQKILDQARDALIGYAAANGYFPCPADYAGNSNGAEAATPNHTSGTCPDSVRATGSDTGVYIGYLPAATLGFTPVDANGYALDAWGLTQNRIRYAVSNVTVNNVQLPFTKSGGMRGAGMSSIVNCVPGASSAVCARPGTSTAANGLLFVCNTATGASTTSGCASGATLTNSAIAVIWSLGPNAGTSGGTSTDEAQNTEALGSADRVFIKKDKTAGTGPEFDDVVTWISPLTVFNRMIAAGNLP